MNKPKGVNDGLHSYKNEKTMIMTTIQITKNLFSNYMRGLTTTKLPAENMLRQVVNLIKSVKAPLNI
jgi:hypothetical protein